MYKDKLKAQGECSKLSSYLKDIDGQVDGIDLRWFGKNSTEAEQRINAYLSDPLVQTAFNIDESHHVIPYKMMNMDVYHQFALDSIKSYSSIYDDLMD